MNNLYWGLRKPQYIHQGCGWLRAARNCLFWERAHQCASAHPTPVLPRTCCSHLQDGRTQQWLLAVTDRAAVPDHFGAGTISVCSQGCLWQPWAVHCADSRLQPVMDHSRKRTAHPAAVPGLSSVLMHPMGVKPTACGLEVAHPGFLSSLQ